MASIVPDAEVFMQFTEKSKQQYSRIWAHFRDFVVEVDFETGPPGEEALTGPPGEEAFTRYFNFLRPEKRCRGGGGGRVAHGHGEGRGGRSVWSRAGGGS